MSDEVFVTLSDLDGHNRPSHGAMEGSNKDEEKSQDCPKSSSNEEVLLVVPCKKSANLKPRKNEISRNIWKYKKFNE